MKFMPSRLCSSWPRCGDEHRHSLARDGADADRVGDDDGGRRVAVGGRDRHVEVELRRYRSPAASASATVSTVLDAPVSMMKSTRRAVDRAARPEMAVGELFQHHRVAAVIDGQRAAGNEADGDAVGEILQFVAVLVAGDEHQDDQHPHGEGARRVAEAAAGGRGCRPPAPCPRRRDRRDWRRNRWAGRASSRRNR